MSQTIPDPHAGGVSPEVPEKTLSPAESAQPNPEAEINPAEVTPAEAEASASTAGSESETANENGELGMEDFGAILDRHERQHQAEISEGEVVKGTVEKVTDQAVIIDIGFKSEGIVSLEEFRDGDRITVKPGDQVDVLVKQLENSEGYVELSRADAIRMKTWDHIELAYRNGTNLTGRVVDRIKGGLRVDIGGIAAFLGAGWVGCEAIDTGSATNRISCSRAGV